MSIPGVVTISVMPLPSRTPKPEVGKLYKSRVVMAVFRHHPYEDDDAWKNNAVSYGNWIGDIFPGYTFLVVEQFPKRDGIDKIYHFIKIFDAEHDTLGWISFRETDLETYQYFFELEEE